MSRRTEWWLASIKAGLATITALFVIYIFYVLGPEGETRLRPVISSITITRAEADGANATKIWFEFDKYRTCPPIGVFWFRGARGGLFEPVRFEILPEAGGGYVNRPTGRQAAGPWRIELPLQDVLHRSFADAQHRCWPLWPTTSEMWTGKP